jgi:hypothetical protein
MAMAVRRGGDVRDAIRNAEARHGQRFLQRGGTIINARQNMTMKIEHGPFFVRQ